MRSLIVCAAIFFSLSFQSVAQQFSEFEMDKIKKNSKQVVENYAQLVNLVGDKSETEQDRFQFSKSFLNLFYSNHAMVYNDLDPEHKTDKMFEVADYANHLTLWYTAMSLTAEIDPETIAYGKIENRDGNTYFIRLSVDKSLVSGVYMNRTPNQQTLNLEFQIAFDKSDLRLEKFKIVGILQPNPVPDAAGTIIGATQVKQNDVVKYQVAPVKNATSYDWTLPAGATGASTTNEIYVEFSINAQSGNMVVKGKNETGIGEPSSLYINVEKVLPKDATTINGKTVIKTGEKGVIYVAPPVDFADSYIWTLPPGATGTSTTNNIKVDFGDDAKSGNITIRGKNNNGEGNPATLFITVMRTTMTGDAGIITGKTVVKQGDKGLIYSVPEISGAESYEWTLPAGMSGVSTINQIVVNVSGSAQSGVITVKGKNKNGYGKPSQLKITVQAGKLPKSTSKALLTGMSAKFCNTTIAPTIEDIEAKSIISYQAHANIMLPLSSTVFITTGLGISSYKTEVSLANFTETFAQTDEDGEVYQKKITGSAIFENYELGYLDLPIGFRITTKNLNTGKFWLYFDAGTILSIPIQKKITGSGTFSYEGIFNQYHLTISDASTLGFASNQPIETNGNLNVKSLIISAYGGVGVLYKVAESKYVYAGITYIKGMSDISAYAKNLPLTTNTDDYNSLISQSTKTKTQAIGVEIGIQFNIK